MSVAALFHNVRFYILGASFCASIFVASLLRQHIPDTQLFVIRTEQVFGLCAVLFWYIALMISPLSKIIGSQRLQLLIFARRAIGVSAAYFAILHSAIALWGQLGGIGSIALLPTRFIWACLFGCIAILILLAMAATSFDTVIRWMTPRRWKILHRFGYLGGVLVLLHVLLIGTHSGYLWIQLTALGLLGIFFALETIRIMRTLAKRISLLQSLDIFIALTVCMWVLWMSLLAATPSLIGNYHKTQHTGKHTERHMQ